MIDQEQQRDRAELERDAANGLYCRHCDVFVGYGAAGVVKRPEGKTEEWLSAHCWLCDRSKADIKAEEAAQQRYDEGRAEYAHEQPDDRGEYDDPPAVGTNCC